MLRKREVETQGETREGKKETEEKKVGNKMEGTLGRNQGIVQNEAEMREAAPGAAAQK